MVNNKSNKVYKPVSDREVARRLSIRTINQAAFYVPIIKEIYAAGLVICERVKDDEKQLPVLRV